MAKRINIVLPAETLAVIDKVAKPGERSRFIAQAVDHYVRAQSRARLRERLAQGYREWADRDLETAAEWFPLEEEVWQTAERHTRKRGK